MIRLSAFAILCAPLAGSVSAANTSMIAPPISAAPGTPVRLRVITNLSSRDAHTADRVEFKVEQDVTVGGATLISRGSLAWGAVSDATPRGRMARSGRLSVNIQGVCMADGQAGALRGSNANDASRGSASSKNAEGTESALAIPAWPVMIFMMGKDVNVPAGTLVTAYLDAPARVDPTRLRSEPVRDCNAALNSRSTAPLGRDGAIASIRSNPDGAEITVDGRYAGNTPSRLKLAPGEHRIAVTMPGQQSWERIISVESGAEVTILAALEPAKTLAGSRLGAN